MLDWYSSYALPKEAELALDEAEKGERGMPM